jgi:hypothetical protein
MSLKRERSITINLNELDYGSIYIKPTLEKKNYCTKCFSYIYYIFSCSYVR